MPARVVLVDDHELAREALHAVLAREPDFVVAGEAGDGRTGVALVERLRPDLVVMDLRMPEMDGLAATRAILAAAPATRVVVLTSADTRVHMLQALDSGAIGFLPKGATRGQVLETLRAALAGEVRAQTGVTLPPEPPAGTAGRAAHDLSDREVAVLRLIAQGRTNHAIGRELGVSENTIKTHVRHLMRKLAVPDRAAAVAQAAELGLLR